MLTRRVVTIRMTAFQVGSGDGRQNEKSLEHGVADIKKKHPQLLSAATRLVRFGKSGVAVGGMGRLYGDECQTIGLCSAATLCTC